MPTEADLKQQEESMWKTEMRAKVPLVTIHGVKGSVLVKGDGSVVWLSGPQVRFVCFAKGIYSLKSSHLLFE